MWAPDHERVELHPPRSGTHASLSTGGGRLPRCARRVRCRREPRIRLPRRQGPRRPGLTFAARRRARSLAGRRPCRPPVGLTSCYRAATAVESGDLRAPRRHLHQRGHLRRALSPSSTTLVEPRRERDRDHARGPVPRATQLGLRRGVPLRRAELLRRRCGPAATRRRLPRARARRSCSTSSTTTSAPRATFSPPSVPTSPTATARRGAPAVNFDGPGSDEVRAYFFRKRCAVVHEFHVDGLRLDAVHEIIDRSARSPSWPSWPRRRATSASDSVVVLADRRERRQQPARRHPAQRRAASGWTPSGTTTSTTPFTRPSPASARATTSTSAAVERHRAGDGRGLRLPGRVLRVSPDVATVDRRSPSQPERFVVFAQNHDHIGNRPRGDRLVTLVTPGAGPAWSQRSSLLAPGFRCCSWVRSTARRPRFPYFIDHGDPALVEAVREGRAEEFAAFAERRRAARPRRRRVHLRRGPTSTPRCVTRATTASCSPSTGAHRVCDGANPALRRSPAPPSAGVGRRT